jgi:nucleoside triphosphate diphosphatase
LESCVNGGGSGGEVSGENDEKYSGLSKNDADDKRRACDEVNRLLGVMAALRDPERGCPWDLDQTFATIAPYTIEEAYEVADAIERADMGDLKDELGDLLLQVVYHARIAEDAGLFSFPDVARAISEKMIRRHPHVFADQGGDGGAHQWEAIKRKEREAKAANSETGERPALFDDIPAGVPALARCQKLQRRAQRIGFDWPTVDPILDKLDEEIGELRAEIASEPGPAQHRRQYEEYGDVLFVLVNLGMRLGIDAESALRSANAKFTRRMRFMDAAASAEGRQLEGMPLDEMEALWGRAKEEERRGGGEGSE